MTIGAKVGSAQLEFDSVEPPNTCAANITFLKYLFDRPAELS